MTDTLTSAPVEPRTPRLRHLLRQLHPEAQDHVLGAEARTIGRAGDLRVDDPAMSRRHAELRLGAGGLGLRDLDSHNGLWVGGQRLREARVADGGVFRLGDSFFLYRIAPVELDDASVPGLLGISPAMQAARVDLARVGPTRRTVVLLGESGTGKTAAARALHTLSGRAGSWVHLNCAAIPENLAESALFGHRAGAFTDARTDSPGALRAAHGGTLFLDEVGLLSPASQARLLVALESGQVTPVGASRPERVDVRVVVATNEDLGRAVAEGRFRGDLYIRLRDYEITLPPLRRRREDLLPLLRRALGPKSPPLATATVDLLFRWHWPFNVREVEKLAGQLELRAEGQAEIGAELLDAAFHGATPDPDEEPGARPGGGVPEREELVEALRELGGNVSEVARRYGRSTKQVYRWCARHAINPEDYRGR